MTKQKIGIIGCGWLGKPLAKRLIEEGFTVSGTTRTSENLALLISQGLEAYQFDLAEQSALPELFLDVELLIIATPHKTIADYPNLISQIAESKVKQVIYTSSTSVYQSGLAVTEASATNPESPLVKIEQLFMSSHGFKTSVIRFGGLIGPGRDPGHFFKSGKPIPRPNGHVNMIHLMDCIQIICKMIKDNYFPTILNAVSPNHPKRKDYYTNAFKAAGRPIPEFDDSSTDPDKIVEADLVKNGLKYQFIQDNTIIY